jgi:hypothetical protein
MGRDAEDGKAVVKHKHKEGKKEGNRSDRRKAAAVDNTFRRTWDKDEFEEKAADREKAGCCSLQEAPLYGQGQCRLLIGDLYQQLSGVRERAGRQGRRGERA